MALVKVNGSILIDPEKVTMLERKTCLRYNDQSCKMENYSGVTIHFNAGGRTFIKDPVAEQIEAAFEDWDRDRPLPY